jgi:F0F1-type ATP synthase assembly protein I
MDIVSRIYLVILVAWSAVMLVWGLAGFIEYFTGITPIIKLQNSAYPGGLQFVHWLLISLTGGTFLIGYLTHWSLTPFAMILLFSNLTVMCTIQTFDFMSDQWSLNAYIGELIFYLATSLFLIYSAVSKSHFSS